MTRTPAQTASLQFLLDNARAHPLCGRDSSFGGSIDDYAQSIRADLDSLPADAISFDQERAGLLVQCFNLGSLLDVLLGRCELAENLVHEAIRTVEFLAELHNERHWLALRVQPVINLARLKRAMGDPRACCRIMDDLVAWAKDVSLREIDAHAFEVLGNCHRAETLKAEQLISGLSGVRRRLLLRGHTTVQTLDPLEFEILLKALLAAGDHDGLLNALAERNPCEEWAPLYAIDALIDNGAWAFARDAVDEMVLRTRNASHRLAAALAVRAAWCELDATAMHLCETARGDEQTSLRLLTLMAVLGDADALRGVHALILASRHNPERLISCVALHLLLPERHLYARYAHALSAAIDTNVPAVSAARAILDRFPETGVEAAAIACVCENAARTHATLLRLSTRIVNARRETTRSSTPATPPV